MGRGQHLNIQVSDKTQPTRTACRQPFAQTLIAALPILVLLSGPVAHPATAQAPDFPAEVLDEPDRTSPVAPPDDPKTPRRHFRIKDPAKLSDAQAARVYAGVKAQMATGYAMSKHPGIDDYQSWRRVNRAPYRSASHGHRYLNNYVNEKARAYRRFESAGTLPVGAVIAKDSFTVRSDGSAVPGALYLMEKMADGFNHASGNWRYTMIMPDGSVFGTTNGVGARQVQFCVSCHLAVDYQDHLFFVPESYRLTGSTGIP